MGHAQSCQCSHSCTAQYWDWSNPRRPLFFGCEILCTTPGPPCCCSGRHLTPAVAQRSLKRDPLLLTGVAQVGIRSHQESRMVSIGDISLQGIALTTQSNCLLQDFSPPLPMAVSRAPIHCWRSYTKLAMSCICRGIITVLLAWVQLTRSHP